MAFILSKLFWSLLAPANLLLLVLVGSVAAMAWRPRRSRARWVAMLSCIAILACSLLPVGYFLSAPLENRFAKPEPPPKSVEGIVVLGGSIRPDASAARGEVSLNETAERMTQAVMLSRLYPDARLIFTGGNASLLHRENTEAAAARQFFREMGVPEDRVSYEDQSRNTYENARFTRDLIRPKPGETWLLVTSARHMPRAVGCFRGVGWPVLPWPVDYSTKTSVDFVPSLDLVGGLDGLNDGLHEWIGLAAYRALGYVPELFPGP